MNVQKRLMHVTDLANELQRFIENELWDEAMQLSQQWDSEVRKFVHNLSSAQFIAIRDEIEELASKNTRIKTKLTGLRAKVLTQIQENNYSHTAIQSYSNTF